MAVYALGDLEPDIAPDAWVHPDAVVIGRVTLGPGVSVWPTAVLRGDYGRIEVGAVLARIDPDGKPASAPEAGEPASVPSGGSKAAESAPAAKAAIRPMT